MNEAVEAAVKAVPFVNRDAVRRAVEAAAPLIAAPATAAERDRIRQLAIEKQATYVESRIWPDGGMINNRLFADLLGDES